MTATAYDRRTSLLEIQGLTVRYGGVVAVRDASLRFGPGITGLIGPNGAGKTSLIDAVAGSIAPAGGRVVLDGRDVTGVAPQHRVRAGLVRTFQSVELFAGMTVREHVLVAAHSPRVVAGLRSLFWRLPAQDRASTEWALEVCGLAALADRPAGELSTGRQKLVGIARALACRPRLLLLDEPAAGLDTEESAELGRRLRAVADSGVALILVDHDMGLVLSICDAVVVMDFGEVIATGTPEQVRADPRVIAAYLGAAAS
jgi:branched-chain amino acid transport system ATP-binding protein